jgi:predicted ester cyclase
VNILQRTFTTSRIYAAGLLLVPVLFCFPAIAFAQGDPGANVNIVGPTPDENDIRDYGLKQQNEPSCAFRPGDAACLICGFNDYRTVDHPLIQEAWQGVAMSCDAGATWTSRVAPGHPAHAAPIDAAFAADPRMLALPGMAVFEFIGGYRNDNRGVLAIQHWLEINKEDADYYEPALNTIIIDEGTRGRFIDKPEILALLDKESKQSTINLLFDMENPALGTIERSFPTGDLFAAFAVFTGSNSVKVLVKKSSDWGKSWTNQTTKLSEDQNLVSGIAMTAMGDSILAVWRRAGDINDSDAIMYAYSNNRGKKWTKGAVLSDICSFDQVSTANASLVTFRTNDFPWVGNDGTNFYVLYSDRNYDGNGDCTGGRPRIVMKYAGSGAGLASSTTVPLDDSNDSDPTTDDAGDGFQFMPAAFGANGKLQVVWYDTRREGISGGPAVVGDYRNESSTLVHRQVDVYTARVTVDSSSAVQVSPVARVSQFRIAAEVVTTNGEGIITGTVAVEGESSFGNAKLYASGSLPFLGDYLAVAAQEFRLAPSGKWISNSSPEVSPITDKADFFVAWADNRDVRGNIFDSTSLETPVPYSPPATGPSSGRKKQKLPDQPAADELAPAPAPLHDSTLTAEGIEDPVDPFPVVCSPVDPQDRTRDANVYGSLVKDQLRLIAPTPSKPLTNLQRAFAVAIRNANTTEKSYRLRINSQPADAPLLGRASWRQLPAVGPFNTSPLPDVEEDIVVPASSTFARTVFLVSNDLNASVNVLAFDLSCANANPADYSVPGVCDVLASIRLGGQGTSGPLQQPNYVSPICDPVDPNCTDDVLQAELHNPELANPELLNPELANPELANPELLNPELANPELANPELLNPELANLGFQNPELANPELANPELANPELANPELANPELANAVLGDGTTWVDYTVPITNTGNVTTSLDADMTLTGSLEGIDSQMIASTVYITPTSRDCQYLPQIQHRILATVNNPDNELNVATIDNPFVGSISAIAAPGQTVFFTHRVFGTVEELQGIALAGFTTSSQAANCSQTDRPDGNTDDYFCQLSLAAGREQILLDVEPPVFSVPTEPVIIVEADQPGGACVDLTASGLGLVTAADNGSDVSVSCVTSTGDQVCTTLSSPASSGQLIPLSFPDYPVTPTSLVPTTLLCSATDDAGNVATVSLDVAVQDNVAPVFDPPLDGPPPIVIAVDAPVGADTASVTFGPYTATDLVDPDGVDVSCVVPSGSDFPIGDTTVTCTASDNGYNAMFEVNTAAATLTVTVNDTTPPIATAPVLAAFEANAPGGATVSFADPAFTDNFALADPLQVDCTPASGDFFALTAPGPTSTSVTCTTTDLAMNIGTVSFDITVQDTTPPGITLPSDQPVIVVANSSGYGSLDFEAQVTVADIDGVDPDPSVLCIAAGGQLSGEALTFGSTSVTCTATDASNNSAEATYTVLVQYGSSFGINFSKGRVKAGSTVPLTFGWNDDSGSPAPSPNADPRVTAQDCDTGTIVLNPGEFPGSSDLRYDASQRTWKFNWQTVLNNGSPLPATSGGTNYCLRVISQQTLQTIPDSGYSVIKIRP